MRAITFIAHHSKVKTKNSRESKEKPTAKNKLIG